MFPHIIIIFGQVDYLVIPACVSHTASTCYAASAAAGPPLFSLDSVRCANPLLVHIQWTCAQNFCAFVVPLHCIRNLGAPNRRHPQRGHTKSHVSPVPVAECPGSHAPAPRAKHIYRELYTSERECSGATDLRGQHNTHY